MSQIPKKLLGMKHLDQAYYFLSSKPDILPAYTGIKEALRRFMWKTGNWRKYGLFHDDILYEYPHIKEAIRRLPLEVQDARNFRMVRAIQCDIKHIYLPEEQWTSYEDDITKGRYMRPYIDDVEKEIKMADEFEKKYVKGKFN